MLNSLYIRAFVKADMLPKAMSSKLNLFISTFYFHVSIFVFHSSCFLFSDPLYRLCYASSMVEVLDILDSVGDEHVRLFNLMRSEM